MSKYILACVDGSTYSESVVKYGADLAKNLNLPLKLLNTVEHDTTPSKTDLSGNIGLGESEEILNTLASDEAQKNKEKIKLGRQLLENLKLLAQDFGAAEVITSQRHGTLYENLNELQEDIRVLIIGISGTDHQGEIGIGTQVEEIIRSLRVPTLLINQEYSPINKVMIAYNGSEASKKALNLVSTQPMFSNVERFVVNVCKDKQKCQTLLEDAKQQLKEHNITAFTAPLEGDAIEALKEFQQSNAIDLIAMGAFSHNRLRDAIFGSFTAKMLKNSTTPLLLLR